MMDNLWASNHPRYFWHCQPDFTDEVWIEALMRAMPSLGLLEAPHDIDSVLEFTLGEGQFGPNRYQLGSSHRFYYLLKSFLPRRVTRLLRSVYHSIQKNHSGLSWPIEPRFAQFQWEILRQALQLSGKNEITFRYFWPEGKGFAFILTHDIETEEGQHLAPILADMEESLGFRSLFNFVPELYTLDRGLIEDFRQRGFEIGVHGLHHDGQLFNSYDHFLEHAQKINRYLAEFKSEGFRSPLTLRNPAWMQFLEMEYDLSFFDTDPYEPMPGGVMSIWPFTIGHFLELPYTLPQDHTLYTVMGEATPRIWLEKVDFLQKYHGMALVNVHPDYSGTGKLHQIFEAFLKNMQSRKGYWNALPRDVASWWRDRTAIESPYPRNNSNIATASLRNGDLALELPTGHRI